LLRWEPLRNRAANEAIADIKYLLERGREAEVVHSADHISCGAEIKSRGRGGKARLAVLYKHPQQRVYRCVQGAHAIASDGNQRQELAWLGPTRI